MKIINASTAEHIALDGLGLESGSFTLLSPETLCALLRRAGCFNCPCPPSTLIRTVLATINGIRDDQSSRDLLPELLDDMISYGDFFESKDLEATSPARLVYVSPPAFVEVTPGRCFIMGISTDDQQILPQDMEAQLQFRRHIRVLQSTQISDVRFKLLTLGFKQRPLEDWIRAPKLRSADDHIREYDGDIERSVRPGSVEDLVILNTETRVNFYNGRWAPLKRQTGRFIARRPQPFGAPLWSVLEVSDGKLIHLVDLPLHETSWRACDEAWHLQQALDAQAGHPQIFRVRQTGTSESVTIDLFSPIPAWAQRRWECVGARVPCLHSLLAYQFDPEIAPTEIQFAHDRMWMSHPNKEDL